MLVRGILTAAAGAVLRSRNSNSSDKKGKATVGGPPAMIPTSASPRIQRNYGSTSAGAGRLDKPSKSAERLDSVPEREDSSLGDGQGEPSAWNDLEEGGSESYAEDGEFDDWDASEYDYKRAVRWYSIVPLGSVLFLLFVVLLPKLIAPKPLPSSPPLLRLVLSAILSTALWCLAHSFRVSLHSFLNGILSALAGVVAFLCRSSWRRTSRHPSAAAAYIASLTSVVHVLILAFLQESLRITSFAILDLHWYQPNGPPTSTRHSRSHDAAFREVWALAVGWALAEVCAGIIQGYEQLALYADFGSSRQASGGSSKSGDEAVLLSGNGVNNAAFEEEAADIVRWSMPCIGLGDDEDVEGAKTLTRFEIDDALVRLANVRARDELEDLYGQPYIEIPVFVALLQRLDSILLSLGNTLLLAAAYLPLPPYASSLFTSTSISRDSPSHTHMIPLPPAFFIVALVHAALGTLHAPPVLSRVGIPAAAYASCMVGLALTFAGVGIWVGVW